jgi:SAM-dependent methyltransferase
VSGVEQEDGGVDASLDSVKHLYTRNLAEHGLTSKSVGWKDEGSQILRFEKLLTVVDPSAGAISVNDWGCGYGAMFDHMTARPDLELAAYRGYDISEEMVEAARARISDPRAVFVLDSKVGDMADFTFVSGTFNVKMAASDEAWSAYIKERLGELWAASGKGLAFNLLTTYVDWKQDNLFYADPLHFFDFCKRSLSPYVTLVHDYQLYEWTICVKRPEAK